MGDDRQAEVDELVEAQANWVATRFGTSPGQASAVLLTAYSAAVGFSKDDGEAARWMALFDGAARVLRAERARVSLWSRDPLLRDLRPLNHLLELRLRDATAVQAGARARRQDAVPVTPQDRSGRLEH